MLSPSDVVADPLGDHGIPRPAYPAWASYGLVALGFASLALVALVLRILGASSSRDPRRLPLALERQGARTFGLMSRLSFYFNCSSLYADTWHRFNKRGLPVLVPTLGTRKEIFLPHTSMKWALSQPARVLGMWDAFSEMFQLGHSLGDEKYMLDTWPHLLSRQVLTRELDDHLMAIREELQVAIDAHLGHDVENWSRADMLATVRSIITQTGSRFAVGLPLCKPPPPPTARRSAALLGAPGALRDPPTADPSLPGRDQEYLRTIMDVVDSIVANAGATGFFPESIRPLVGKVICFPTYLKIRRLSRKYYDAEFARRIAALERNDADQPVDLLQKMLRYARKHRPHELATEQMTRRMCMTSLAFVYLASFTTTNILTSLVASDREHGTVAALRDEAESFAAAHPDPRELWSRPNTTRMVRADSVMRESLRLYTVPTRAIVRKVMVDGVVTDTGLELPKGALVSFVSQPMHTDPDRYEDPLRFDPFRFARMRESGDDDREKRRILAAGEDVGGKWHPHSFLSTAGLLAFGRGKNACPGRLLMEIQLKMLISHLVRNYDLRLPDEYDGRYPANKWVLEFIFPSGKTQFEFRRRKSADAG